MKTIKKISILFGILVFVPLFSCLDLTELNEDPNHPQKVSSNYILTYVLSNTAKNYENLGYYSSSVAGAMQYMQYGDEFQAARMNHYNWDKGSWAGYYTLLRNVDIIYDYAVEDGNPFFEAVSLTLKSFLFGVATDLFGDIPYSESLQADEELYFPKYDEQKDIYLGILEDLKRANDLLSKPEVSQYSIAPSSDLLYGGNAEKWRKFTNALRMRYAMRLYDKKAEMESAGINIVNEFNQAASFTFTSNNDDAIVKYLGATSANSAPGGPLNASNPPYSFKLSAPLVDALQASKDPRLYRWASPVEHKWDLNATAIANVTFTNMFGDKYTVQVRPTTNTDLDTSFYVGMPVGLETHDGKNYNKGDDTETYPPERSPYISYMHDRYRKNTDPYIDMDLVSYSEVEFLLAEAAMRGGFSVNGTAEEHYKNGIKASLNKWGINDGANGFNFNTYYSQPNVNYTSASNKLERIMGQKWISLYLHVEAWFDWRRTGYPDLKTGPVAGFGAALPIRFMYPEPNQDEKYLVNYNAAVNRLEATVYVPAGQTKDHHYSKIWVIQNTGKPY